MILSIFIFLILLSSQCLAQKPEQVHLSFGETADKIVVTWSTFNKTEESIVLYGPEFFNQSQKGSATLFQNTHYIHRVVLTDLIRGKKYYYICGSRTAWSNVYWFKVPPPDNEWQPRLAVYGDMGYINPQSVPRLTADTQRGLYDGIFHIGDFAYDLDANGGKVGDMFMQQIEPIAGFLPYMTCPGNHEEFGNFSHYKARFSMPGLSEEKLYYSLDIGPVHLISISTEVYYFNYTMDVVNNQLNWLKKDLKNAVKNRQKQPWIIVVGHRPMYCSTHDSDDCHNWSSRTRVSLEDLFYQNGIDLEIWAHEHVYERLWPVYNHKVFNGSFEKPYENPKAPVHIITGSAGCQEVPDHWMPNPKKWSAFRNSDYGYSRMTVFNSSHLHFEQVSDDKNGEIIDSIWIVKTKHDFYDRLNDSV